MWPFLYPPGQAEYVPLEDELEALCSLHAARAELTLSGDLECFLGVASTVEAFAFREDADGEEVSDFTPPSAMFSVAPPTGGDGDGDGGGGGGGGATAAEKEVARLEDGRRRRLAALENCLDAFDRFVHFCRKSCLDRSAPVVRRWKRTMRFTQCFASVPCFEEQPGRCTLQCAQRTRREPR